MTKPLAVALVALCTAGMFSACATNEPAPSSTSQSVDKKKQQQGVGVGAESVNQPGRSDPSGATTGDSVDVGQESLSQPGRSDPSGSSTGVGVQSGGGTVNQPGRRTTTSVGRYCCNPARSIVTS